MNNHTISIIIPTYNREKQLKECIESILKQNYNNIQIIVIDDNSTQNIENYINQIKENEINIEYYKNKENKGAGFGRKIGYKRAIGEYIIFCDDDDYYTDFNFFKKAVDILDKDDKISLILGNTTTMYEKQNILKDNEFNFNELIPCKEYLEKFQYKLVKPTSTFSTVFRKKILDMAKLNEMNMVNDSSIYLRALVYGNNAYAIKEPVGIYRVHSKNISSNIKVDFLKQNIEEKYIIKNMIEEKNIFNSKKWWNKQLILTLKYYIEGSNPSYINIKDICKWCDAKYKEFNIYIKVRIYIIFIKKYIKNIIRR
ncbi:MAG: glycosyltransferase family 2 protein [Clostridia bacterium]|nr:glycosyltransferase family 2 protein [Clostridia bacterium]